MRNWTPLLWLVALASSASAGPPELPGTPGTCSRVPDRVVLVGSTDSRPDTHVGAFDVVVCRHAHPVASASIIVSPSQNILFAPGVRLGRETDPATTFAECPSQLLHFTADQSGTCRITVTGSVDLAQQVAGVAPAVSIYTNGILFGDLPVICYDLDGVGGLGAGDLSKWITLFSSGEPWLVADYNGDGVLGAEDLSLWLDVFHSGEETESARPLCP